MQADRLYARNDSGDVTAIKTAGAAGVDTQCLGYDYLHDLTQAWTPAGTDCTVTPTASTIGGAAPYWTSYVVDPATGNRTQVIHNPTTASAVAATDTYAYPVAGSANPHAVQSVTHSAGGGSIDSYGYDAAGDTTTRPGQTLTYDATGKLATVTTGGVTQSNVYDASGALLLQTDATNGTTLFLGESELHVAAGSTTATVVRTYTIGGTPIAERATKAGVTGSVLVWLSGDANHTQDLEVAASSGVVTRRFADPYGNTRGATAVWSSGHGYLNAPTSSLSALTQLGARAYDPVLGRFLSVDSVLVPGNPQQNNGYAYSHNNPVTTADPSGLDPNALDCRAGCHRETYLGVTRLVAGWHVDGSVPLPAGATDPDHPASKSKLQGPERGSGYRYTYDEYLAPVSKHNTAIKAMQIFQGDPSKIFPFPVEGCPSFTEGAICNLHATFGGGFDGDGQVKVHVTATSTKFTVVSNGYFDSAGSTITFNTYEKTGNLYLQQVANAKSSTWLSRLAVDAGGVRAVWELQAANLRLTLAPVELRQISGKY